MRAQLPGHFRIRCSPRRERRRRAMVLIMVLIIVVMVSLAGFSFVATMHNEDKAARVRGDELQAEQLVQSGMEAVLTAVSDAASDNSPESDSTFGSMYRGALVFEDSLRQLRGRFSVLSPQVEQDQLAGFRYGVENESAKLNLFALMRWEQRKPNAGREALMRLPNMTESIADALLDWVDTDDSPRAQGAESEYYGTLEPAYSGRNGVPDCLDELLLVRDVTRQLLYGRDRNRNFQIDPEEEVRDQELTIGRPDQEETSGLPWAYLLTVHSAERNVDPQGQPRVFLNEPQLSQLHEQLLQFAGRELADFIIAYRQFGPDSGSDSPSPMDQPLDYSVPARYNLATALDVVNARVRIPSRDGGAARVVVSPLSDQKNDLRAKLLELLDSTTTVPRPILRGRINVNLAASAVLRAVPGFDEGLAGRVVAARRGSGGDAARNADRRHPVWLWFERMVDLPKMREILPYLTCGGDVYRAQIVGFFDKPGPTARAEVVIDATQPPARVLYSKDLRVLGRGYTDEMLGVGAGDSTELTPSATPGREPSLPDLAPRRTPVNDPPNVGATFGT